jgi:hypothetical protein
MCEDGHRASIIDLRSLMSIIALTAQSLMLFCVICDLMRRRLQVARTVVEVKSTWTSRGGRTVFRSLRMHE